MSSEDDLKKIPFPTFKRGLHNASALEPKKPIPAPDETKHAENPSEETS